MKNPPHWLSSEMCVKSTKHRERLSRARNPRASEHLSGNVVTFLLISPWSVFFFQYEWSLWGTRCLQAAHCSTSHSSSQSELTLHVFPPSDCQRANWTGPGPSRSPDQSPESPSTFQQTQHIYSLGSLPPWWALILWLCFPPAGNSQAAVPTATAPSVCSSELHRCSTEVNPELGSKFGSLWRTTCVIIGVG